MLLAIFRKFFALFFLGSSIAFGQVPDNVTSIELSQTTFPIERPFTISVIIPNSENRVTIPFPDITGFTKQGISTSVSPSEVGGKTITNQVITQNYLATASGRFRLPPFTITINGETVRSDGAVLVVLPSKTATAPTATTLNTVDVVTGKAAFLSLRASKSSVYAGEDVALTLSLYIADDYPYVLNFTALDKQLQEITKKIRPANSWEENLAITELKPISILIRGKRFREFRIYQSVFFPLSNQDLRLPAVSLQLVRPRPNIGPPSSQPETVVFTSRPLTITVKALPPHPLRGRVPVGSFQLEEGLDRQGVTIGQSVRYTLTVIGEGNIATLPAPALSNETAEFDVFPPEERHTVTNNGNQVTGRKTFSYFIVPHQNGEISLANRFQWIYFDPKTGQYDTLRPQLRLQVGNKNPTAAAQVAAPSSGSGANGETSSGITTDHSLYAGIEAMDSTLQPISISVLVRAIANVLILVMLIGMVFVFFKKQDTGR
ncbi:protein BatD [Spirosoma sp. KCTC 42546]|uniref:BatD family protein n=1 Tax=Spirosoma sp. KCTC 42546 TaxID=2520506 RepID=UPI0011570E3B|nr:BatD family protein [Spirosoma sp. KCTC 42546]QDK83278.1 protein BatD [Spirosoma sp. KCTC 42546]